MDALVFLLLGLAMTLGGQHRPGMTADAGHFQAMAEGIAHATTIHDPCVAVPPVVLAQHAVKRTQIAAVGRQVRKVAWDTRMSVEARCAFEMAGYHTSLARARLYQARVARDVHQVHHALARIR